MAVRSLHFMNVTAKPLNTKRRQATLAHGAVATWWPATKLHSVIRNPLISQERLKQETSNSDCAYVAKGANQKYANSIKQGHGAESRDLF